MLNGKMIAPKISANPADRLSLFVQDLGVFGHRGEKPWIIHAKKKKSEL
jgi:hypothetical protein